MAIGDLTGEINKTTEKDLKKTVEEKLKYEEKAREQLNKRLAKKDVEYRIKEEEKFEKTLEKAREKQRKKDHKNTLNDWKEINKLMYDGATSFGQKLKADFATTSINILQGLGSGIAGAFKAGESGVNSYLDTYQKNMSAISTRLQGFSRSYGQMTSTISKEIGMSPYASQTKVMENLASLVDKGISYNVEQRAFLASVSDRIATTFDNFDSSLLRIIRIQQADSTAARLGLQRSLTQFLNENFSDTSYLSDVSKSISSILMGAESQLGYKGGAEFEYAVQKWLGSLYSVGVSENVIQSLAQGIGYLGTGDISALSSNTGLQNLLLMGAQRAGLDYGDLMTGGISAKNVSSLMTGIIEYVKSIAEGNNLVVKTQYANLFGLTLTDMTSLLNLSAKDLTSIASNMLKYEDLVEQTEEGLRTLGQRTSLKDMIENVMQNTLAGMGETIANNPALYNTWIFSNLLSNSGLSKGFDVSILGTSVNALELLRLGIVGGTGILQLATGLSGLLKTGGVLGLGNWDATPTLTRGQGTSIVTTGVSSGISTSMYMGSQSEGIKQSIAQQKDDYAEYTGQEPEERITDLIQNNVERHLMTIIDLLENWNPIITRGI